MTAVLPVSADMLRSLVAAPSKSENPGWQSLAAAHDEVRDIKLLPMRQAAVCGCRLVIDWAVAVVLGVRGDVIADWRRCLPKLPEA